MIEYGFHLTSSLEKRLFDIPRNPVDYTSASMLKNEIFSFQLTGWIKSTEHEPQVMQCRIALVSDLAPYIKVFSVGYVPSMLPTYGCSECKDYLTKTPGLFPDPLYPIEHNSFKLVNGRSRSLWFAVEPAGQITGTHCVTVQIFDDKDELLGEKSLTLDILDAELPKLDIYNTGWFHGDCIGVLHNKEIGSAEYYEVLERYLAVYKKFGHNTVLTPIFTPPLDVDVGGERPTNQLVKVFCDRGVYSFDFSALRFWLELCKKHGIEYFEISHLFTQWGDKYTPKIMATVDGEEKRIFGWDVEATGGEYESFLDALLPELVACLKQAGVMENCLFHVSDEPQEKHLEDYAAAKALVTKHIPESQLIDAMGNFELYKAGVVKRPVVAVNHIRPFLKNKVDNMWAYYCCSQFDRVANRFMAMPSYRNRVLGTQLYKHRIKGFLQWGFNFWFSVRSRRVIDPYHNTDADVAFPSGDAFLVYPLDENGDLICSLRLYVFNEAMQDYRAMKLLEKLTDRETVCALLEDIRGFDKYPRNSEYYLTLRETVNRAIQEKTGK